MKKVVVSVTNDLVTDQRVLRTIGVLQELGYDVHFVGRKLPSSLPCSFNFKHTRFKLLFNAGFLFYANYNLRLFFFLLFKKFDVYLANDLDTLLANALIAKWRKKPLVYDSHEYFTGVPEIQNRPFVKGVWVALEKWLLPKADAYITVNQSIAQLFKTHHNIAFNVVRNIGDYIAPSKFLTRSEVGLPEKAFVLINQGAGINIDRGMEEMLATLPKLPSDVHLLIVGSGDVIPSLKEAVTQMNLKNRVHFVPKQPYDVLLQYTKLSDCGLSLDKNTNVNYRYSLPNKLFDYINCEIPIVVSNLQEVASLVRKYQCGEVTASHRSEDLAQAIVRVKNKGKGAYIAGLKQAAVENNWTTEKQTLVHVFRRFS